MVTDDEYEQTAEVDILITNIDRTPPVIIAEDKDTLSENIIVVITLDKPAKVTTP
ncbi:MAG: hypothetical protein LBO09_09420 [Candidatus Peribacteria bacterium]|jgi:hypothetical protein|nr:hypothetical protein [Candidatus Peribacteria bacterium]